MTRLHRWVALFAVALATAGCSGKTGPAGSTNGTLVGIVTSNDLPLPGATVQASPTDRSTTTGADGAYSLALPAGVYTVSVSAAGYEPQVLTLVSVVAGDQQIINIGLARPPPAQVVARAGADRFQAGFGAAVQLDGSASFVPEGGTLTYSWAPVTRAGPIAQLDDPSSPRPTFTTLTIAQLEAAGLYASRHALGVQQFTEADVDRATYEFELTVSDGVSESTDRVVVRSVVSQPGLAVVPVDTVVPVGAGDLAAYAWTCKRDEGGAPVDCEPGVLTGAGTRTPSFRPNQEGTFTLTPAAGEASLVLQAARYVGAREVAGVNTCFSCHAADVTSSRPGAPVLTDKYAPWSRTGHATYFERALGGTLTDAAGNHVEYRGECIRCHTTGYNPDAANGGFAQLAAVDSRWVFPNTWEALGPDLQALASVTCENCHGPGSLHRDGPTFANIGKSFAAVDCAQCHATEPYENQGLQWVNSRHSRFISGFRPELGDPALQGTCASCHSSQGFVAWARRGVQDAAPAGEDVSEPQTCSACHDPHGEATFGSADARVPTPRQLRVYDEVATAVPGLGARGVGPAALCMTCHNSRTGVDAATVGTLQSAASQAAPHPAAATDVLLAKNAATFGGGTYPSSVHTGVPKLCVGCHMSPTPPRGSAGHNLVGGHSFAMRSGDVVHLEACTSCHAGLTSFDRTAYGDYDGDGFLEGVQTEVTHLSALVQEQLALRAGVVWPADTGGGPAQLVSFHGKIRVLKSFEPGVSDPACSPAGDPEGWTAAGCFAFAEGAIPQNTPSETALLQAAWNYFLIEGDRSRGLHNTAFAVSVLQRTYQAVAGVPVPGAVLR